MIGITADLLSSIAPQAADPDAWAPPMHDAAVKYEIINTPKRLAMWLAQMAHESRGYSTFVENLNYSAVRLRKVWPTRFRTDDFAKQYAHRPEKLANLVYADRFGNGPPVSGDGWRYRGRGMTHLTFRDNYRDAGEATGFDLVDNPDMAAEPEAGSAVAGWYWQSRDCNAMADLDDYEGITRVIQGALGGWDQRVHWLQRTKRILRVT